MKTKSRTPSANDLARAVAALVAKSNSNWKVSEQLRNELSFNAAANRLYYSLFQAVKAYAVKIGKIGIGESERVHRKMRDFVKAEGEDDEVFSEAMDLRAKADYWAESAVQGDFDQGFLFKVDCLRNNFVKLSSK